TGPERRPLLATDEPQAPLLPSWEKVDRPAGPRRMRGLSPHPNLRGSSPFPSLVVLGLDPRTRDAAHPQGARLPPPCGSRKMADGRVKPGHDEKRDRDCSARPAPPHPQASDTYAPDRASAHA